MCRCGGRLENPFDTMNVLNVCVDIFPSGGDIIFAEILLCHHVFELPFQTVAHSLSEHFSNDINRPGFERFITGWNGWAEIGSGRLQTSKRSSFAGAMNANQRLKEECVG